ncbi:hypothetical protein [Enterococcus cecorum]|uniref:hypothetical protein n=1 Tax=Enterococcus cecorum TaxID=44008 RepID=UPI001FAC1657|nr:hypothetical protein [Enterococcus cecorum]MCJ0566937.1 hypothetical protein [Enterococcus cecorum]
MANNEPQTELIEELNDRARNIERLLNTAIFILQGMAVENENRKEERDNAIAFLSGAMALVTQTKEITDKYLETALFKDE